METGRLERWKQTRSKGFLRYVLVKGVLMCGLPLFVVMIVFMWRNGIAPGFAGLSFLLFILGGAIVGSAMWVVQERLFRKAIRPTA